MHRSRITCLNEVCNTAIDSAHYPVDRWRRQGQSWQDEPVLPIARQKFSTWSRIQTQARSFIRNQLRYRTAFSPARLMALVCQRYQRRSTAPLSNKPETCNAAPFRKSSQFTFTPTVIVYLGLVQHYSAAKNWACCGAAGGSRGTQSFLGQVSVGSEDAHSALNTRDSTCICAADLLASPTSTM